MVAKQLYAQLLVNGPWFLIETDSDSIILANDNLLAWFGVEAEDVCIPVAEYWEKFVHPADRQPSADYFANEMDPAEPNRMYYSLRLKRADGRYIAVDWWSATLPGVASCGIGIPRADSAMGRSYGE